MDAFSFGGHDFGFGSADEVGVVELFAAGLEVFGEFGDVFVEPGGFFLEIDETGKRDDEFHAAGHADGARGGFGRLGAGNLEILDFGELADGGGHLGGDLPEGRIVGQGEHLRNGLGWRDVGLATDISYG